MWAWVGIVYQGVYFSAINPAARAFAAAFLVQAVVFAIHAIRERGLEFGPRSRLRGVAGAILIGYAMIAYPLIGLFVAGDRYPSLPLFGMTPCPLLIFTFGMLVWASCARWWLWLIPFAWSLIGGSAVLLLSVPQDWALPISAVAVLLITLLDRPLRPRGAQSAGRR
jgi:small-conductance mechanosensitive channel